MICDNVTTVLDTAVQCCHAEQPMYLGGQILILCSSAVIDKIIRADCIYVT